MLKGWRWSYVGSNKYQVVSQNKHLVAMFPGIDLRPTPPTPPTPPEPPIPETPVPPVPVDPPVPIDPPDLPDSELVYIEINYTYSFDKLPDGIRPSDIDPNNPKPDIPILTDGYYIEINKTYDMYFVEPFDISDDKLDSVVLIPRLSLAYDINFVGD